MFYVFLQRVLPTPSKKTVLVGMNLHDAIRLASRAHAGQYRDDGSPYIEHPLAVLDILWHCSIDLPLEASLAAVLHDALEDTSVTYEDILRNAGSEVATVVRALTKDDAYYSLPRGIRECMYLHRIGEVNKIYPYTLLLKMIDRLHNISTAQALPLARRQRLFMETRDIYLPFLESHLEKYPHQLRSSYLYCILQLSRILKITPSILPPHTSLC